MLYLNKSEHIRRGKMEISERSKLIASGPVWKFMGIEVTKSTPGYSEIELAINENLLQIYGNVHGGVQAMLIDGAIAIALAPMLKEDEASATVELKTNFIRPGNGEKLYCKGSIKHKGKNLVLGQAEVTNDLGKLVASGSATFMITKK
jgi:uncharacterized protein (TIGR00369 family)